MTSPDNYLKIDGYVKLVFTLYYNLKSDHRAYLLLRENSDGLNEDDLFIPVCALLTTYTLRYPTKL